MNDNFQQAADLISKSQNILLTMHERMDADDGGAGLAMAHALKAMGKNVTHAIKKGVPPILNFLPGNENIIDDITDQNFDLLITFGCATIDRTGSQNIQNLTCATINFDHHPDNAFFGDINVVDKAKSSVAELVYDFFIFNNWPITKDIATCLLTGIVGDTGGFLHSNTQSSTLKAAGELMNKGALADKIIREMFKNKNTAVLKAWGKAIGNAHYDAERKIIYSIMTEQDLNDVGEIPPASFEGFVETLNTAPEAKFALFLRQDGNLIKGSLRSGDTEPKNVDVSKIAQLFGGGGHKQAAGFAIIGKLEKDDQGKWKVV
jgi:phosphoesterase RecJ-like protein